MSEPYALEYTLVFLVEGESIAITDQGMSDKTGKRWVWVEEVRKNGQEDTHMSACLDETDDGWKYDEVEGGGDCFETYHSKSLKDGIREYLKNNPPPAFPEVDLEPQGTPTQ